jgi:hypothetical protein
MFPSRNPVAQRLDARPRMLGGATRMSSESADTVNIVEPMPPSSRNAISCQYAVANAQPPVDTATTLNPIT